MTKAMRASWFARGCGEPESRHHAPIVEEAQLRARVACAPARRRRLGAVEYREVGRIDVPFVAHAAELGRACGTQRTDHRCARQPAAIDVELDGLHRVEERTRIAEDAREGEQL